MVKELGTILLPDDKTAKEARRLYEKMLERFSEAELLDKKSYEKIYPN